MKLTVSTVSLILGLLLSAIAGAQSPECMNKGQVLDINDAQVLQWKSTTANNFHSRGHIQGTLLKAYPDQTGHHHLEVQIGANATDTVEVIYNESFGAIPQTHPGSQIEACGDYITANAASGGYPPSPDGALIHWVHKSTSKSHDSGFLVVDGTVCGDQSQSGGRKGGPQD